MEESDTREVEVVEVGKASELTKGYPLGHFMETTVPPFGWWVHIPP